MGYITVHGHRFYLFDHLVGAGEQMRNVEAE
jgi:hypothetical protein